MWRGNHLAKVDEKGRVKIPAAFLESLRESGSKFFVTSDSGDCVRIYPMKHWNDIEKKLAKLSSYHPTRRRFLTRANYFGQVAELDAQGRILVQPILREAAQMKGEVNVLGYLTYLEVWNHGRFLEAMKASPITDEDCKTLNELGI
jgi:MraZ protein